jgi:hypothetical protein
MHDLLIAAPTELRPQAIRDERYLPSGEIAASFTVRSRGFAVSIRWLKLNLLLSGNHPDAIWKN